MGGGRKAAAGAFTGSAEEVATGGVSAGNTGSTPTSTTVNAIAGCDAERKGTKVAAAASSPSVGARCYFHHTVACQVVNLVSLTSN